MTNAKTCTTGTRVLLFVTSLYAALWLIALLLHVPAVRLAFAVVVLLIAVGVLLTFCAWLLRKLWSISGQVATTLRRKGRDSQSVSLSTAERENEAQA